MSAERSTYVESTIIMTTVRVVAPFVFTLGLFVTLHGAESPGGGFQGGVIMATVVVMLSFAFGIGPTRDWVSTAALTGLIGGGVALFGLIGFGPVALGGAFLELPLYPVPNASKYGIELVEVGIAMIVTGVITALFFLIGQGAVGGESDE